MTKPPARSHSQIARSLVALSLAAILAGSMPAAIGEPLSSTYLGEIRRNEAGQLIAVPRPAQDGATDIAIRPAEKSVPSAPVAPVPLQKAGNKQPPKSSVRRDIKQAPNADVLAEPPSSVIKVGPSRPVHSLSMAASLAKNGDTIEIDAGDYIGDVAVWKQKRLTIRGVGGGKARLIANGASAEQKGIWVIRDSAITAENLEFTGARVADKNGAGIRLDSGRLTVRNCVFHDNENGILTASGDFEVEIENSEFGHNGAGDGRSHNIYVGAIRKLTVTGSYFHHAQAGHLIKSRAAENHILYNRLTDEADGHASYELEFPNGGIAYVVGNIIQQGSQTENSTIISYGAEGYKWPRNELYLVNNTIADDRPQGGVFLRVAPGANTVKAFNNLLVGKGTLDGGPKKALLDQAKSTLKSLVKNALDMPGVQPTSIKGEFKNNLNVDLDIFAQAVRFDYRIIPGTLRANKYEAPGVVGQFNLAPQREYLHPASTKVLVGPPTMPGALQTPAQP